jgi:hypothetical protein
VTELKMLARDWQYDAVFIGDPGAVIRDRIIAKPDNLRRGWMGCDFKLHSSSL